MSTSKQLTRVYAVSFPKQKELKRALTHARGSEKARPQEAGKRDGAFHFQREGWCRSADMVTERDGGSESVLEKFMRQAQIERGYLPVVTPHIGKKELYVASGHYEKYGAGFIPADKNT